MIIEPGASLAENRYELRERIGTGGMASVWLAHDTRLDRAVAIKVPADHFAGDPRFSSRFEREARIAAGLSHPNLVPIYDYRVESGRPYLVMEYVEGDSLAERLEQGEAIDARSMATAVLGGLAHIHSAGVIHRDVKPDNILIKPSGRILITDFGIAQPTDASRLTSTGQVLGTLRYIAPEIMAGERASERSDLYSCGIVLTDCGGRDDAELRPLIDSLTAADPADRPVDAASALAALPGGSGIEPANRVAIAAAGGEQPTEAMPTAPIAATEPVAAVPPPPRERRPARARLIAFGVLGLLIAAVVGAFAISGVEGDGNGGARAQAGDAEKDNGGNEGTTEAEQAEPPAEEPPADPAAGSAAAAAALNDQGYALTQAGDYQGAVELLAQAVEAFPPESTDGSDINYVYALYNYGHALRLSGDPEAAIPVLEQRLQFNNQRGIVLRELEAAQAEAGYAEGDIEHGKGKDKDKEKEEDD